MYVLYNIKKKQFKLVKNLRKFSVSRYLETLGNIYIYV